MRVAQQNNELTASLTPSTSATTEAEKFVWRTYENHPKIVRPRGYKELEGTGSMTILKVWVSLLGAVQKVVLSCKSCHDCKSVRLIECIGRVERATYI